MISKKHKRFFELAKKLSFKSKYYHRLGAVVVKKGKVLGVGFNQPHKTHPRSQSAYRTIHAELDAILGVSAEDLAGSTIYVYRQHKSGLLASAKPCEDCMKLITHCGIKRVFYTENGGYEETSIC